MHEHHGLAVRRTGLQHAHPDPVGVDEGRTHARKKIHDRQPRAGPLPGASTHCDRGPPVGVVVPVGPGWQSRSPSTSGEWGKSASLRADRVGCHRRFDGRGSCGAGRAVAGLPAAARRLGSVPESAARGPGGVRFRHRSAGLRAAGRREDQDRGVAGEAQGRRRQGAGPDAGQPGRAGRLGRSPRPARRHRARARGRRLRLDRLRPPRRRRQHARAVLRSPTTAATTVPSTTRRRRPAWSRRGRRGPSGYAAACATKGGALLSHLTTDGRRQGPGHHPQGAGAPSRSTSTASPTAPTSARSTPPCSRRTCGAGGVRRRGRPARGLVPGQPRPGRRVPEDHRGVLRLDRQARRRLPPRQHRRRRREALLRRAGQAAAPARPAARSARPSGPTSSCRPGYYVSGWEKIAATFAKWVQHRDAGRARRRSTTTRPRSATTTATRSTSPSSAPTRPGRSRWRKWLADNARVGGHARRSRPGATPGTTRPARLEGARAARRWRSTARPRRRCC